MTDLKTITESLRAAVDAGDLGAIANGIAALERVTQEPKPSETDAEYEAAKSKLNRFVEEVPLKLALLERNVLEHRASGDVTLRTIEQRCVNFLRHCASAYDEVIRTLNSPGDLFPTTIERHVLHVERRSLIARIKRRILDEIATTYPWLKEECARQKQRDGVEDDPGEFVLPFGPFKGEPLRNVDTDYLLRLLGQSFVRKSYRTRIERHLAQRGASALPLPE